MKWLPAIALLILLLPPGALAGRTLDDAQTAFDSLAMDEAAPLFEKALGEPATRDERIKAWKGLGLSLAFMAEPKKAQAAFEKLLVIYPSAKIDTSLGPRVTKPFELAKRSTRGKRASLTTVRLNRTGDVKTTLVDPMRLAAEVKIFWRKHGAQSFESVSSPSEAPLVASTPADQDIEVYVQAVDPAGGVVFEDGTQTAFNSMPAVIRAAPVEKKVPDAVVAAVTDAKKQSLAKADEEVVGATSEVDAPSSGSSWPLYLGGAVLVIGGGAAAAYFLGRPPELALAPADKTGQLPWRF